LMPVLTSASVPAGHVVERHPLAAQAFSRLAPWWPGL